jgi:hypothetical protein
MAAFDSVASYPSSPAASCSSRRADRGIGADIARGVQFLASDEARGIRDNDVIVDAGLAQPSAG